MRAALETLINEGNKLLKPASVTGSAELISLVLQLVDLASLALDQLDAAAPQAVTDRRN